MTLHPVVSSNLAAIGYDAESKCLEVKFKIGTVYQYHDVPAWLHAELMTAPSHGVFFAAQIRNAYRYTKLESETGVPLSGYQGMLVQTGRTIKRYTIAEDGTRTRVPL